MRKIQFPRQGPPADQRPAAKIEHEVILLRAENNVLRERVVLLTTMLVRRASGRPGEFWTTNAQL